MHILKRNLYNEITRFSKILIYGAGGYANKVYAFMKKAGLREMIDSFVVTELKNRSDIDGIPIRCVDDISFFNDEDTAALIAVSKVYEEEIAQTLQSHDCLNMIKFSDFVLEDDDFYDMLRIQSDEQFLKTITDEYAWNDAIDYKYGFGEEREETENVIARRNGDNIDRNTIVFISGDMKPRIVKIIGALAKKRYNLIVLEYEYCNELVVKDIEMYNNVTYIHCKDIVDVFCESLQYNPLVYYFEPAWGNCSGSEIMIRHRSIFGKIAFAPYDVLNDGYVQISEKNKLMERYCLENADGVVWRWFSREYLERKKGFVYKGKAIQFLDYCKGFELDGGCSTDQLVKICFVQGAICEYLDDSILRNNSKYAEWARIDTILEKLGNREDCIFHIFIGVVYDCYRREIEELEKKYTNFHCFYGMKHNELIHKISEYDFGCFLTTGGEELPELESIDGVYYGSCYLNSEGNRFFDYLDAGIPIIATRPKKQCEYFDSLGVLVRMNLSNIDIDYLKKNKAFYKENVKKAKPKLLIDNQIERLIDFFEEL